MSLVHYLPILPGDARDATALNSIWNAIAAASPLGSVNFAEEGLDYRPLEDHPVAERLSVVSETVRDSLATSVGYTQFVQSGTTFRLTAPGDLPASLDAGEFIRIRSRVWYETTVSGGVGFAEILGNQLVWNNGGATAVIAGSKRELLHNGAVAEAVVFCEGWLKGPITTIAWAELRYRLTASGAGTASARPSKSILWATLFKRQLET